jgi:cytochrome c7-like protein
VTGVGVARAQPLMFSHKHHVADDGIDCRYCHTSVEDSAFAGIPSTDVCMNCHRQIWNESEMLAPVRESYRTGTPIVWNRVHDLPDFVYFDHSIHVAKGVGCETCHGRVDQMPLVWKVNTLQMEWCLECHRNPERHVRPRDQIVTMGWRPPNGDQLTLGRRLVQEYRIERKTDCSTCHR